MSEMAKFQGGISIDHHGYLVIKAGPLRDTRVHILVAEAKLGRKLTKDEDVHHRNLDKKDPRPENLLILGKADHGAVSNRQHWFLKNRDMKELALYQQWIEQGGVRPDLAVTALEADSGNLEGRISSRGGACPSNLPSGLSICHG